MYVHICIDASGKGAYTSLNVNNVYEKRQTERLKRLDLLLGKEMSADTHDVLLIEGTHGSAGMASFRRLVDRVESYKQMLSKRQKQRLAAVKRRGLRNDTFGDWKPLIDRVFDIWEES